MHACIHTYIHTYVLTYLCTPTTPGNIPPNKKPSVGNPLIHTVVHAQIHGAGRLMTTYRSGYTKYDVPSWEIYVQLKLGKYTFNVCTWLSSICVCRKGCHTHSCPLLILSPTHIHARCRPAGTGMPAAISPDKRRGASGARHLSGLVSA